MFNADGFIRRSLFRSEQFERVGPPASETHAGRRIVHWDRAMLGAVAAFLPLAFLALWTAASTAESAKQAARHRFAFNTGQTRLVVEQRLLAYEQALRGGIAVF